MSRNKNPLYNSAEYRRRKRAFFASVPPICSWPACPVPGRVVDMSLSGNHPWGPTLDHKHPTSNGGDFWSGWQLAHRRCNLQKGDRVPSSRLVTAKRYGCNVCGTSGSSCTSVRW